MKDLRDKILEMMYHELTDPLTYDSCKNVTNMILELLEKCPAMNIEQCPWGKENVEFREIFLRGINRQLEGVKVEEECPNHPPIETLNLKGVDFRCDKCGNTGKIRQPATWEDLPPLARIIEGLMIISDEGFLDIMDKDEILKDHIKIAKSLLKTKTGRLVIDSTTS